MPRASSPMGSLSPAFRGGSDDRCSYIKAARHGCAPDVVYNVPGMFDVVKQRAQQSQSRAPFGSTGARDSYIRASRHGCAPDVVYDVPGLADAVKQSRSGTYAFKPGPSDRDSYIRAERRGCATPPPSTTPQSPSARTPRGSATPSRTTRSQTPTSAFRGSGGRDSYLRDSHRCSVDAVYAIPGLAEEIARSSKGRILGTPTPRDSYIRASRHGCAPDVVYDVPGLADAVKQSRSGTYAFMSGRSDRDSYIRAESKGRAGGTSPMPSTRMERSFNSASTSPGNSQRK